MRVAWGESPRVRVVQGELCRLRREKKGCEKERSENDREKEVSGKTVEI